LFGERDFADPENSDVFRALWLVPDAEAQALVGRLFLAAQAPLAETPLLGEVLSNGSVVPLSAEEQSKVESALGPPVAVAQPSAPSPEAKAADVAGVLPDALSGTQPAPLLLRRKYRLGREKPQPKPVVRTIRRIAKRTMDVLCYWRESPLQDPDVAARLLLRLGKIVFWLLVFLYLLFCVVAVLCQ
jgi:hypothetical protein